MTTDTTAAQAATALRSAESADEAGRGPDGEQSAGADRARSPAARRALAEAEARRRARDAGAQPAEPELGGRGGADPARYGDWEVNGRAIDF